jgi:hypothetical protein
MSVGIQAAEQTVRLAVRAGGENWLSQAVFDAAQSGSERNSHAVKRRK